MVAGGRPLLRALLGLQFLGAEIKISQRGFGPLEGLFADAMEETGEMWDGGSSLGFVAVCWWKIDLVELRRCLLSVPVRLAVDDGHRIDCNDMKIRFARSPCACTVYTWQIQHMCDYAMMAEAPLLGCELLLPTAPCQDRPSTEHGERIQPTRRSEANTASNMCFSSS